MSLQALAHLKDIRVLAELTPDLFPLITEANTAI